MARPRAPQCCGTEIIEIFQIMTNCFGPRHQLLFPRCIHIIRTVLLRLSASTALSVLVLESPHLTLPTLVLHAHLYRPAVDVRRSRRLLDAAARDGRLHALLQLRLLRRLLPCVPPGAPAREQRANERARDDQQRGLWYVRRRHQSRWRGWRWREIHGGERHWHATARAVPRRDGECAVGIASVGPIGVVGRN